MAIINQTNRAEQPVIDTKRTPARFPMASLVLGILSLIGMLVSIWMIFLYAPEDSVQGEPQRIFYFHVPSAWLGMLGLVITAAAGIGYLIKKDERWDFAARASAELGAVFITLALISGSIWGKTTWGTWWTWDARLTTTLILWFIYIAYLMLRSYMGRTHASARAGAVLAILGVIDVPIIYESVNWWRTLHPTLQVGVQDALPPSVVLTLMISLTSFTLLFSFLMIQIYQLQRMQTLAQRLRAELETDIPL
ncbi:MAG TPA: cytochrome c biogenesis protein CcsA [Ktedonobacteraceae bacterium]|jgi:heme exporter protein C|nr:cytochrome c biogenesis protein CcsA [Ktedonobacteraceae bacterium]